MEMNFGSISARIAGDANNDRRSAGRVPVTLDAKVRELGAEGVEARLINVSEHGFMAATEAQFEVGSRVWLMLPGRTRANAIVRWTAGDKLGAEFAEPLPIENLLI